jgi:hypothetical protein
MQDPVYHQSLLNAVHALNAARLELFECTLDLAMKGPLKAINDAFEPGDQYIFQLEHLEGTRDGNLEELTFLIKHMDRVLESLINLNDLED